MIVKKNSNKKNLFFFLLAFKYNSPRSSGLLVAFLTHISESVRKKFIIQFHPSSVLETRKSGLQPFIIIIPTMRMKQFAVSFQYGKEIEYSTFMTLHISRNLCWKLNLFRIENRRLFGGLFTEPMVYLPLCYTLRNKNFFKIVKA